MVLKDFECDGCGVLERDVYAPAGPARPVCDCGTLMHIIYPGRLHVDHFAPVDVEVNGTVYHLTSIHQARTIERIAEQQARNGEGQPYVFRDFSQDHSNRDRNVFGEPPHPQFSTRSRRGIPYVTRYGVGRDTDG